MTGQSNAGTGGGVPWQTYRLVCACVNGRRRRHTGDRACTQGLVWENAQSRSDPLAKIPDSTSTELWVIRTTLRERCGEGVELHLAGAELRGDSGRTLTTGCPVVFWRERGANFTIHKAGELGYRAQCFYTPAEQFSTDRREFDEIGECATAVLQVQADDERTLAGMSPAGGA